MKIHYFSTKYSDYNKPLSFLPDRKYTCYFFQVSKVIYRKSQLNTHTPHILHIPHTHTHTHTKKKEKHAVKQHIINKNRKCQNNTDYKVSILIHIQRPVLSEIYMKKIVMSLNLTKNAYLKSYIFVKNLYPILIAHAQKHSIVPLFHDKQS